MAFWVWILAVMCAMIAVLQIAPTEHIKTDLSYWHIYSLNHYTLIVLSAVALSVASLFAAFARLLPRMHQPLLKVLIAIMMGLMLMVGVGAFGFRAFLVHNAYDAKRLSTPIKVVATVQVYEISDSVYDEAYQTPYRQKAVLTNIRPIQENTNPTTIANPFYHAQKDAELELINQQALKTLPSTLTVLLYAQAAPQKSTQSPLGASDFHVLNHLSAGKQMQMTLSLSQISPSAQTGFDSYRWLLTRHIHANAKVLAIVPESLTTIESQKGVLIRLQQWRQMFRDRFYQDWHTKDSSQQQAEAVTLSLLTGDRALIDKHTKELYQFAGISHLLAISGTHVLFLAVILASVGTWGINHLFPQLYYRIPRSMVRFGLMLGAALGYALFVGFEVPAMRTVFMLLAVGVARWLLVDISPLRILALVALVMAWIDPYVLWQAGFWLSFVAVAFLMRYESQSLQYSPYSQGVSGIWAHLVGGMKLQVYLFVAMLPISILLFGKVSLLGLGINLVAVGVFGWVLVPINLLAGLIYTVAPSISAFLWSWVSSVLEKIGHVFETLSALSDNVWLIAPMSAAVVILMALAMLVFGIGGLRAIVPRRFALLPMMAVMWAMSTAKIPATQDKLHMVAIFGDAPAVTQMVLVHNQTAWLILSAQPTRGYVAFNTEEAATLLMTELKKQGIRRLEGVIVQTPDESLAKLAGQLSLSMPIKTLWYAGDSRRFGKLQAQSCQAKKQWQSADGQLSISALTGWQEIENDKMHTCSLSIQAPLPIQWQKANEMIEHPHTNLIVDGATEVKIWQVWQLLCQQDKALIPNTGAMLITHSQSPINAEVVRTLGANQVVFGDTITDERTQSKVQAKQQALLMQNTLENLDNIPIKSK